MKNLMVPSLELKRHGERLSPEKTDEVIEAIADLIVNYLIGKEAHERGDEQTEG